MADGTAKTAVSLFKSWKGLNETTKHAQTQKKIINPYNKISGRHLDCKTTPWCQIAVVSCLYQAGVKKFYITAGCKQALSWYKNKKRYKSKAWTKNNKPKVGWQVFYDFKGNGNPTHTGIVVAVSGNKVTVYEGNKSNAVGARTFNYKTYKYLLGWGIPYYLTAKTTTAAKTNTTTSAPAEPVAEPVIEAPVVSDTAPVVADPIIEAPVVETPVVTEPEPTPAPAPTPKPAAKPTTSAFKPYKVVVTPKVGLYVRRGPGLTYRKVSSLACGAKVTILGKNGNWGRIAPNKWINLSFVKKV